MQYYFKFLLSFNKYYIHFDDAWKKITDFILGCIRFVDIESSGQKFFSQELRIHKKFAGECKASIGK